MLTRPEDSDDSIRSMSATSLRQEDLDGNSANNQCIHCDASIAPANRPATGSLTDAGEVLACEIQEPLGCHSRLVPMLDVETHLDDEIDQQPHIVQQRREAEVEQPDAEVLRVVYARKPLIVMYEFSMPPRRLYRLTTPFATCRS